MFHTNATTQRYYGISITYYTHNKQRYADVLIEHDELPAPYIFTMSVHEYHVIVIDSNAGVSFTMKISNKRTLNATDLYLLKRNFLGDTTIEKLYSLIICCRECYASSRSKCYCTDDFCCTRFSYYNEYSEDSNQRILVYNSHVTIAEYHILQHRDQHHYCYECNHCDQHCYGYHDETWYDD